MVTTTELLDFLTKAQKLGILEVTFRQTDEGYVITMSDDWYDVGLRLTRYVFITNEGESPWDTVINGVQSYDFYTMDRMLDEKLEEQTKKEKRKELIESLTPEERELLWVS